MVDNFKQIESLLEFPHEDSFYFVQVLQRKKDHPGVRLGGSNNNSRLIRSYYIPSVEKFNIYKEEIVKLCEVFNARAGINLNPRSRKKAAHAMLIKLAHQFQNEDFRGCSKIYDSVCGDYHAEMDKRWLVDVDDSSLEYTRQVVDLIQIIQKDDYLRRQQKQVTKPNEVLSVIPTKSGHHIITQPFDVSKFKLKHDIHKNNPTVLYIP